EFDLVYHDVTSFMGRYVIRKVYLSQLAMYATTLRVLDLEFLGPNNKKKAPEYYAAVQFKPSTQEKFGAIYELGYSGYRIVAVAPQSIADTKDAIQILSLFDQGLERGCDWQPSIWCVPDFKLEKK
ncbi:MAG: hypothetical protein ACTSYO_09130, partial [Candidatus Ranarchaeia archaeon]